MPGRLCGALRERLGHPPFEIDVVPLNDASPSFRRAVADEGVLLHEEAAGESLSFWVQATSHLMDLAAWHASHGRAA